MLHFKNIMYFCLALLASNAFAQSAPKIVVGQTADFSKAAAPILKEFVLGANAYFAKINTDGGINGAKVELISIDDGFDPKRTVANAKVLIDNPAVVALFGPRGTPNLVELLPLAQEAKIAVVAPLIGASVVRDERYTVSFPLRATYKQEVDAGLKSAAWSGKKMAVIYPDDAYGKEMSEYVKERVANDYKSVEIVSYISFDRIPKDFIKQTSKLAEMKADVAMLFCSANACASFLKEWDVERKTKALPMVRFVTNSIVDLQDQREKVGAAADFLVATQIMPSPTKFGNFQSSYVKALKEKEPSYPSYEGWVSAHVLVEAMKKAKKPITRASMITALETLRVEMDYGFVVDFSTRFKNVPRFVEVVTVNQEKRVVR